MSAHQEMNEFARWEARFATPDYAFGKEPNYFLKSCQQILPRHGQALAVADGEGTACGLPNKASMSFRSIFRQRRKNKAWALAAERGVKVTFVRADVHVWDYPQTAFDVVVEIFAQFSPPARRAIKWRDMRRALKSGGVLIIQGYTPKQLEYATGGPKQIENLYTRAMLEQAFGDFRDVRAIEEEREMREGTSHAGMSAVIGLTAIKP